jgi:hypothetical protein
VGNAHRSLRGRFLPRAVRRTAPPRPGGGFTPRATTPSMPEPCKAVRACLQTDRG